MEKFNLDDLTLGQIKEIQGMCKSGSKQPQKTPFVIGKKYLIRTVTMTQTGEVTEIYPQFLVLKDAAWIADTGRFSASLENQELFNEVEPFKNDCIVGIGSIVDATEIVTLIKKLK